MSSKTPTATQQPARDEATSAFVPIANLVPSPRNVRRTALSEAQLDELASSIALHGILQPLVVRPANDKGKLEIVCGHQRHAAATKAGLDRVPVILRDLDDGTALEIQIVENLQREGLQPIEEAEGYDWLIKSGVAKDELAAKVGKSKRYVYQRLQLLRLPSATRKAMREGRLATSVANLIARIPDNASQVAATKRLAASGTREAWSFRDAADHIQRTYMLRLRGAPFDTDDAGLVKAAGACSTCPKRTGNQRDLFPDVKSADVCTDPGCFRSKVDAAWARAKVEHEAAGLKVVDGAKAKKLVPWRGATPGGMVRLDGTCHEDPKHRNWGKLIRKAHMPPTTLVRTDHELVHLVDAKDARKAAIASGHKFDRRASSTSADATHRRERRIRAAARAAALANVVERVEGLKATALTTDMWRWLARAVVDEVWSEAVRSVAKRRELGGKGRDKGLDTFIRKAARAELRALVFEVLGTPEHRTASTCKLFGINLATHVARVRKAKAKPKRKTKGKSKSTPAAERGKRKATKRKVKATSKTKTTKRKTTRAATTAKRSAPTAKASTGSSTTEATSKTTSALPTRAEVVGSS